MSQKSAKQLNKVSNYLSSLKIALLLCCAVVTGCSPGNLGAPGKKVVENEDGSVTTTITTSSTSTTSTEPPGVGADSGCRGSYVGNIVPPPYEVRIANRNRQLIKTGFPITGNDAIDNKNTGGGGVDGGMYLEGNFAWETDKDCNVIKGGVVIFGYDFPMFGAVNKNRSFELGFEAGPVIGFVNGENQVAGQVQDGGETWIYGQLEGKFTPRGKI
jgi:hypothetical protein